MKNNTDATVARVYFRRSSDSAYTDDRSLSVTVPAGDGQFHEYLFDFSSNANWNGKLKRLRFDPIQFTYGTVIIESIELAP